jgi:N-acetyl-gamma-glutamyl-phosphate reductase
LTTAVETEAAAGSGSAATERVRVAVAGATGYVGRELLEILARHPRLRVARLMSSGRDGKKAGSIGEAHPALRGKFSVLCEPLDAESLRPAEVDLVFLATPHETAHDIAPGLVARGLRVIDLSAAFRVKDAAAYPRWYGFEHKAPEALAEAVYGLVELNREAVRKARLVANPGCYSTSVILGLAPLVRRGWLAAGAAVICDSKSGASGAGRAPNEKLHFVEVNENCRAYALFNHRHLPEMLETLGLEESALTFTPHLLPVTRGILSTIYVKLDEPRQLEDVISLYRDFYEAAPLVRVLDGALPEIQSVAHTNYSDLGFAMDAAGERLVIVSALDNLGKGAAGQAVQNMNLMFGLPEEMALA